MQNLLIPVRKVRSRPGTFEFPKAAILDSPRLVDHTPFEGLTEELRRHGVRAKVVTGALDAANVRIHRTPDVKHPDGYKLRIDPKGIVVFAKDDAGAYYGVQTLRELIRAHGTKLDCVEIEDWPVMERRGFYLDCSRGKVPSLDTLKQLVVRLAGWKLNEFQLYIENVFSFKRHPLIGRGYSPFTAGDIQELQEFCKLHHVKLVPSLASMGHLERILAIPAYHRLGEFAGYQGYPAGTTVCVTDPHSADFITELYDEFLPLFEPEDFNACCDEPWELGNGRSKSAAEKKGKGTLYLDFVLKLRHAATQHGKRLNIWGDIVLDHPEIIKDIPKDIVVLNWEYNPVTPDNKKTSRIPKTRYFAESGLEFIVCPGTSSWPLSSGRGGISRISRKRAKSMARRECSTRTGAITGIAI